MKLIHIKIKDSYDEWFNIYVGENDIEENIKKELELYSKIRNIDINNFIIKIVE